MIDMSRQYLLLYKGLPVLFVEYGNTLHHPPSIMTDRAGMCTTQIKWIRGDLNNHSIALNINCWSWSHLYSRFRLLSQVDIMTNLIHQWQGGFLSDVWAWLSLKAMAWAHPERAHEWRSGWAKAVKVGLAWLGLGLGYSFWGRIYQSCLLFNANIPEQLGYLEINHLAW